MQTIYLKFLWHHSILDFSIVYDNLPYGWSFQNLERLCEPIYLYQCLVIFFAKWLRIWVVEYLCWNWNEKLEWKIRFHFLAIKVVWACSTYVLLEFWHYLIVKNSYIVWIFLFWAIFVYFHKFVYYKNRRKHSKRIKFVEKDF